MLFSWEFVGGRGNEWERVFDCEWNENKKNYSLTSIRDIEMNYNFSLDFSKHASFHSI